ncbi:MAG: hypothetical protein JWM20_438 [Patescibacteria group bacterium]|nr:hypothetical protein [Patescibacteria group bacterium]
MIKNKKTIGLQIAIAAATFAIAAVPAFAELNVTANGSAGMPYANGEIHADANMQGGRGDKPNDRMQNRMDDKQNRGDDKIDLRLKSLTDLSSRINAMVKVSGTDKASLTAAIQAQIDALTNLKAKINADTDAATIKADMQSITNAYRIFMLVEPKARIAAAADRALTIGSSFATLSAKLSANISTASSQNHDVASLNATLADMNAKVADANAKANAAISLTANLQPDNGNAGVAASNNAAIDSARADIKIANDDLKAAYNNAKSIVKTLHDWKIVTNASVKNQ